MQFTYQAQDRNIFLHFLPKLQKTWVYCPKNDTRCYHHSQVQTCSLVSMVRSLSRNGRGFFFFQFVEPL